MMARRSILIAVLMSFWVTAAFAQAPPAVVEYYHVDAIGSVRAVTNEQGQVVRAHGYQPFGREQAAQPGNDSRRFAGKERDAELTATDYSLARYYSFDAGRFATVDQVIPVREASRIPQLWNRYTYALNNPLRYTDPDGRCIWDLCIGEIAVVAGVSEAVVAAAMAASAASVIVWNKRKEIAHSVIELGKATNSALQQTIDSVKRASRADPYAYPDNYPRLDGTGKAHTKNPLLPKEVPESWTREMLEDAATTLRRSIERRQEQATQLGEDAKHRKRLNEEQRLLRQIEKVLKGS